MKILIADSANNLFTQFGIFISIIIAIALVVAVFELVALILNSIAVFKARRATKTNNANGIDGATVAKNLLDSMGMNDVSVQKGGFFRTLLYGDYYNAKTKTIYLRKKVMEGKSVRSVSTAVLNVVYAEQGKNGNKKFLRRAKMQPLVLLAPYMFVPLFLIGLVVDLVTTQTVGVTTAVFAIVAFAYYLFAMIWFFVNIPVEKQATKRALEIIKSASLLNDDEYAMVEDLYQYMIVAEIANMILAIVYFIEYLIKLIALFAKK